MRSTILRLSVCLAFVGCGPSGRPAFEGSGADGGEAANCPGDPQPENCNDGIDNDCDGLIDRADPDCSGVGTCPVCGMVQHPLGQPLALPDGVGDQACTTAFEQSSCPSGQLCYSIPDNEDGNPLECREPYTSKLNFTGFAPTQTFTDVSNIQSVCITMEHSWARDLEIDLISPTGQRVELQKMAGQEGSEIYLGIANDCDSDDDPVPGIGAEYCWTPTATNPDTITAMNTMTMDQVVNCNGGMSDELPPGNYKAASTFTPLVGSTLNGDWEIAIADLWPIDNGYVFKWQIAFDPSIVQNCSGPVIQ